MFCKAITTKDKNKDANATRLILLKRIYKYHPNKTKMSRIQRAKARRDKAKELMQLVEKGSEDKRPLDIPDKLTKLLNDISAKKISFSKEVTHEWETVAMVARTHALITDGKTVYPVLAYVPEKCGNIKELQEQWEDMGPEKLTEMLQIRKKYLTFNV
jgi:hypothetical protein